MSHDKKESIFVFGSNQAGRHGAGSALAARRYHGAIYGRGSGRQGQSYAIPTKDFDLKPLDLRIVREFVAEFLEYARAHPELNFWVTAIGTGYAGRSHAQMAPMFKGHPDNCKMPTEWKEYL